MCTVQVCPRDIVSSRVTIEAGGLCRLQLKDTLTDQLASVLTEHLNLSLILPGRLMQAFGTDILSLTRFHPIHAV